jgi:hypothetical protein
MSPATTRDWFGRDSLPQSPWHCLFPFSCPTSNHLLISASVVYISPYHLQAQYRNAVHEPSDLYQTRSQPNARRLFLHQHSPSTIKTRTARTEGTSPIETELMHRERRLLTGAVRGLSSPPLVTSSQLVRGASGSSPFYVMVSLTGYNRQPTHRHSTPRSNQ